MVPVLHPRLAEVFKSISTSAQLEKIAGSKDPSLQEKAVLAKIAVDAEIFASIKTAMNPWAQKALTGLVVGGGAALPVGLMGTALLGQAEEKAKRTTADIRNKVLQGALGLAGIGAGLYGLHRLSGGEPVNINAMVGKRASDNGVLPVDAIEKLATVGLIDALLDEVPGNVSDETKKLASEIKILNRGYGVKLLYEISHG